MKQTHNIGPINGLIRIMIGFALLSWLIAKMSRNRHSNSGYFMMALCAGAKIGSGILRYCPFTAFCKQCFSFSTYDVCISPIKEFIKETMDDESESPPDEKEAINPS